MRQFNVVSLYTGTKSTAYKNRPKSKHVFSEYNTAIPWEENVQCLDNKLLVVSSGYL
jgi:hypothetical protein